MNNWRKSVSGLFLLGKFSGLSPLHWGSGSVLRQSYRLGESKQVFVWASFTWTARFNAIVSASSSWEARALSMSQNSPPGKGRKSREASKGSSHQSIRSGSSCPFTKGHVSSGETQRGEEGRARLGVDTGGNLVVFKVSVRLREGSPPSFPRALFPRTATYYRREKEKKNHQRKSKPRASNALLLC